MRCELKECKNFNFTLISLRGLEGVSPEEYRDVIGKSSMLLRHSAAIGIGRCRSASSHGSEKYATRDGLPTKGKPGVKGLLCGLLSGGMQ
jgi:hypothetical protein